MKNKITPIVFIILSAITVMTGCNEKQAESEIETHAESVRETVAESTSAKESVAETESSVTDYTAYLNMTIEEFMAANETEQQKAVIAYGSYLAEFWDYERTPDSIQEKPEQIQAVLSSMKKIFAQAENTDITLKELAEKAGDSLDTSGNLEEADMGEYRGYLDYTSSDWTKASEEEKEKTVTAYLMAAAALSDSGMTVGELQQEGVDLSDFKALLEETFSRLEGTQYTLKDVIEQRIPQEK